MESLVVPTFRAAAGRAARLVISVHSESVHFLTFAGHNILCAAYLLAAAGFLMQRSRIVFSVPFAELFGSWQARPPV